ncbi:hypothetical protein CANTEDRAFT_101593 [Yamadazyma tenuis ATCC 10573]|uniref:Uncharacterized protein n=2 Tax=Candida tenuis TaxID=2315449 RepID=G3AYZ1_CANTC|nr:uncharacterized protein CANTEDRAFT_101593 [Yamadazyma tenuis ATCC 10573]EGV65968.1 hypothetical protein CANTEDRAFT_101593 [Yamadazyma tenuis ATCC 10573]
MPSLDLPSLSSTGETYTTPSVTVPPNDNNPYILTTSNVNGTVFIAVGSIVGAMLLAFILYHLIRSITASRNAKKALLDDKQTYEKYQNNNSTAYGLSPSTTLNFFGDTRNSQVGKLPLLSHHATKSFSDMNGGYIDSQLGDTSTLYQSEVGMPTVKNDVTKMFISPTAEVMSHNRVKSQIFGSNTNLFNNSMSNMSNTPDQTQHSTIPNLYISNDNTNSEYSLSTNTNSHTNNHYPIQRDMSKQDIPEHLQRMAANSSSQNTLNVKPNRKTIPSMYLEDLIDE